LIPEESAPPQELRDLEENLRTAQERAAAGTESEGDGFVRAQVDPYTNALHRVLLRGRRSLRLSIRVTRRALAERAAAEGPAALTPGERKVLLYDPDVSTDFHYQVWACADRERAERWIRARATSRSS
jgi:membrane glycosyltransferase